MTLPLWAPFFGLTLVCMVVPPPAWMRRLHNSLDWLAVGVALWVAGFWGLFVWWLAS